MKNFQIENETDLINEKKSTNSTDKWESRDIDIAIVLTKIHMNCIQIV